MLIGYGSYGALLILSITTVSLNAYIWFIFIQHQHHQTIDKKPAILTLTTVIDRTVKHKTNTHNIPCGVRSVSFFTESIHANVAPKEGELVTGKRVFQRGKRDGPLKDDEEEEESDVEARTVFRSFVSPSNVWWMRHSEPGVTQVHACVFF